MRVPSLLQRDRIVECALCLRFQGLVSLTQRQVLVCGQEDECSVKKFGSEQLAYRSALGSGAVLAREMRIKLGSEVGSRRTNQSIPESAASRPDLLD